MTTLTSFITDVATNPALQSAYTLNPASTMTSYGLTAAEIETVLAGDKSGVETMTGKKSKATAFFFISNSSITTCAKGIHH